MRGPGGRTKWTTIACAIAGQLAERSSERYSELRKLRHRRRSKLYGVCANIAQWSNIGQDRSSIV